MRLASPSLVLLLLLGSCASRGHERELVAHDVRGERHVVVPIEGSARAAVLLFVATDCPISNAFAPEVNRILAEYQPRGVEFRLVYADGETDAIRRHVEDFGYRMPALLDFEHELVEFTGATMSPEAVVLSPSGEVLYRGRIDDTWVDYGKQRAQPTRHDLRLALDAVLAGERPEVARTEAIGCFLPAPAEASCCDE